MNNTKGLDQSSHVSRRSLGMLLLAVVLSMSLLAALAGCGGSATEPESSGNEAATSGSDSSGTANIVNPWVEVESIDAVNEQVGANLAVPEGAEVTYCGVCDGTLGEVQFKLNGQECSFRAEGSEELTDISGLHSDLGLGLSESYEFTIANTTCYMFYNQDGPGYCHWYDDIAKVVYSVSINSGATQESLEEIATALVSAQILM